MPAAPSASAPKMRLGDRLLERGLVTQAQLEVALREQKRAHRPLGRILTLLGFVSGETIARFVAEDLGLQFVRAAEKEPDPLLLSTLDSAFVLENQAVPLAIEAGTLRVAMVDPADPARVAAVRARFPYPIELAVTTEDDLHEFVRSHLERESEHVAQVFREQAAEQDGEIPVERLVDALLRDAIFRGATDIHVEPDERVARVRYRIDGVLVPGESLPSSATAAVVSRIKILAGMDISERRRPQDGRIRHHIEGRDVDMRVSIMPCTDGENVVIRILDKSAGLVQIGSLGMHPDHQRLLTSIGQRPHGLFLVTGPTGSGKTTTLYAVLGTVDAMRRNVATVEDPVEYRMPLLRQTQIDSAVGFGFEQGLRALLRQDPDVILVGEIRDRETADMAIRASLTGHLVFSTLHTNSSIGAIPRLVDIGVDAWLLEDSLIGVLAQRLVGRVCRRCAEPAPMTDADRKWLGAAADKAKLMRGKGCPRCNGTGISGRTSIAELFLPDDRVAEAIRTGADVARLRALAVEAGFQDLMAEGRRKVSEGITTRDEVERVCRSHRIDKDEREDV
ncbi:MAG: type II/IV secretion system protein [Planctomycetes bacterium]|nr:type II/IV secretion system protein [Planctomycetota bacterium]